MLAPVKLLSAVLTYSVQTIKSNGLEGSSHHGKFLEHLVEVVHRQRVETTVVVSSHARCPSASSQQTNFCMET